MRTLPELALTAAMMVGIAACTRSGAEPGPESCAPVDEPRLEGVDAESLAGEYTIEVVAMSGEAAGSSAEGRLWLRPNPPDLRSIRSAGGGERTDAAAPLYGWTDLPLESVGAVRIGDPESDDPQAPGVLVVTYGNSITLRLGSEANRRDVLRFDGGFTALRVRRAGAESFAGSWASGVQGTDAEGYFCARRSAEGSD